MLDENDVHVGQKRLLEKIREREENARVSQQSGSGVSDRYAKSGTSVNGADSPGDNGPVKRDADRETGATETNGLTDRLYQRVRPVERQGQYTDKGPTSRNRASENTVNFRLKNPFSGGTGVKTSEPVKLFSKIEAENELERLSDVYFHGSGLLDDILQITVKGHEEVQIWQLDTEEATQLAKLHLARAQTDKQSAASARALLRMYDRLYMWMLALPRAKATVTHVQTHGGFSFK